MHLRKKHVNAVRKVKALNNYRAVGLLNFMTGAIYCFRKLRNDDDSNKNMDIFKFI